MMKKMILLIVIILVAGCGYIGSYYEPEVVEIGKSPDELKMSPCACLQVELPQTLPDWFVETI